MSGIVLSSATRQSLLAAKDTAALLATTQNRLATGKKVSSALDNATNFFTASALDGRANDLSTLLDNISNGVQTIQAANKGLTSLQRLNDQLKSTAQQALASTNAFTAKATSTSTALTGAIATNLLSTGPTEALGSALGNASATAQVTTGTVAFATDAAVATATTGGKSVTIDGVAITLAATITTKVGLTTAINDALTAGGSTVQVALDGSNNLALTGSADGASFTVGGTNSSTFFGASPTATTAGVFKPAATSKATALGFAANDTISVNGNNVTVTAGDTIDTLTQKITLATKGDVTATFDATTRKFKLTAKDASTAVSLADGTTGTALVSKLGLSTTSYAAGLGTSGSTSALSGKTLTVQVANGTAKTVTFGTNAALGQISTLDQLNASLLSANAQASLDATTGKLSITTVNESGADSLTLSGSATGASNPFVTTSAAATIGGDGLIARDKLVKDYNSLLSQFDQLTEDAGYNGTNLLSGDTLKVSFNEKNTSSLTVAGSAINSTSLGLNVLSSTDFQDSTSINVVLAKLGTATNTLKSAGSTLGTNLSVIQNRQDFTHNLINVLQTGSSNLTTADLNEEAANSQALSTRQSLAISALSLANTAQQNVLQLLR